MMRDSSLYTITGGFKGICMAPFHMQPIYRLLANFHGIFLGFFFFLVFGRHHGTILRLVVATAALLLRLF
eukprot:scaffold15108_cov180-Amphora_coffeaeformis.AAC.6